MSVVMPNTIHVSKKYLLKISPDQEYLFSLIIFDNRKQYEIQIMVNKCNLTTYAVTWCNYYKDESIIKLKYTLNDVDEPMFNTIEHILRFLTFEYDYYASRKLHDTQIRDHISNFDGMFRENALFNVNENNESKLYDSPDYILTYVEGIIYTDRELQLFYNNDQLVKLNTIICDDNGLITEYRIAGVGEIDVTDYIIENSGPSPTLQQDKKFINKLLNYYGPIILKNVTDSCNLYPPLCKLITEYCISRPFE